MIAHAREGRENPVRVARGPYFTVNHLLLSSLYSTNKKKRKRKKKKITRNVNQGTQDELHTIHDRINGALCSDIKRHNRVFAFVPARARIRIRKKEKEGWRRRGGGRHRKSDMAYSITSPSLLVLLQPDAHQSPRFAASR